MHRHCISSALILNCGGRGFIGMRVRRRADRFCGREDQQLIGMISLEDMNRYPQYKELEYAIAAQERGNGYAVEAVEAMLRYAFLQRDISVVAAWVRAFNQPSVRVLQRCRFTHEGTLRRHARDKGDTLCYSILKEEWMESQKENLK